LFCVLSNALASATSLQLIGLYGLIIVAGTTAAVKLRHRSLVALCIVSVILSGTMGVWYGQWVLGLLALCLGMGEWVSVARRLVAPRIGS